MSSQRERKRTVAITLAFVASIALAVGALGPKWLVSLQNTSISLRNYTLCEHGGACASASNFELIDLLRQRIDDTKVLNKTLASKDQIGRAHV